jgi:predicted restriction endonuclease
MKYKLIDHTADFGIHVFGSDLKDLFSATFDRLFDRGLIAITSQLRVAVSSLLLTSGDKKINEMICLYHDTAIIHPRQFLPLTSYLEWHQHNVFKE